ncbi:MAG: hypothetical protein C0597_09190 [Marinilabiliales bacterium]|nr:MAG: hypothetical protein C0597_09190 [Marinilabiliales bacterium]
MSKFKATVLIIIFFLLGVLVDRSFLYYEIGEKNKLLLEQQQSIKEDYEYLIQKFERVEEELKFRMMMDSIISDSLLSKDNSITN